MDIKPKVIYIHFNKQRAKSGYAWTVHTSKACIPAKVVRVSRPVETVWKPDKKNNPRAFIKTRGFIKIFKTGIIEIT